jgi:hypothetical protein
MQFNSKIPQVLTQIERKVGTALARTGRAGRDIAASGTPVDTGFAQKSVHYIVKDARGTQIAGPTVDRNGYPIPAYPSRSRPTVFVGSNTAPRPDHFTGPGGYYLGLELGLFSRKGQNMLMTALTTMIMQAQSDIRDALS